MKRRVWVYLRPEDSMFLDVIGGLVGAQSRHEQMEFVTKLCRLILPDPKIVPYVLSRFYHHNVIDTSKGPVVRAWVYLNEDDLKYLNDFARALNIESRSKTMRYVIGLVKLFLRNSELVSEAVEKALTTDSYSATNRGVFKRKT